MEWFVNAITKKYATFTGRARRQEYWMFALFYLIIAVVLSVIENIIGSNGVLGAILSLGLLLPSVAIGVRRLHDTGRSGWWLLIALVPLVGFIVLLVFMVLEGQSGSNAYGPDPKASPV